MEIIKKTLTIYNDDNKNVMSQLADNSIDVICIDPPYLYLKGQKLEKKFDEVLFFSECKRLLTKKGFIVMFGRGISFYRWNCILHDLGFEFKEEVIWNKSYGSSPLMAMTRVHESISIHSASSIGLNKVKVPYNEIKTELSDVKRDLKRLLTIQNSSKNFEALKKYLETGFETKDGVLTSGITISNDKTRTNRVVSTAKSIIEGMNEKSIIKVIREHYKSIHPTQKPIRLLERLLALVVPNDKPKEEIVIADFFAGSMSCMEAVYNMGMKGIAVEIDKEYYDAGKNRLLELPNKQMEMELK